MARTSESLFIWLNINILHDFPIFKIIFRTFLKTASFQTLDSLTPWRLAISKKPKNKSGLRLTFISNNITKMLCNYKHYVCNVNTTQSFSRVFLWITFKMNSYVPFIFSRKARVSASELSNTRRPPSLAHSFSASAWDSGFPGG